MITYLKVCLAVALIAAFLYFASQVKAQPKITVPPAYFHPLDNDLLLRAIAETENWDGESQGAAGEQGPWQILPSTWRQYTRRTMPYSRNGWAQPFAQNVLHEHASWCRDEMEKHGLPQTAYTFALFWKAGAGRVLRNGVRRVDREYSERASNLYRELVK